MAATVLSAPVLDLDRDGHVLLTVHVQPGARRAGIVGTHGDALKVRVAAPPVDGKANAAVVELLTEVLDAPVQLVAGASSRRKRLRITGLDQAAVQRCLDAAVAG
jgi:uncharacterized protein (TIGR00251 family)